VITVELVGGPADGARFQQIDVRHVLPIPAAYGPQEGCYRLREGAYFGVAITVTGRYELKPLLYDYQPPERLTT